MASMTRTNGCIPTKSRSSRHETDVGTIAALHPDRSRRRLSSGRRIGCAAAACAAEAALCDGRSRCRCRGAVAQGALSLSEQTVRDVMVPFEKVFMLDEDEVQPPPLPSVGRRSRPIPTGAAAHFAPCVHLL
jgi:hypothetical protein